MTATKNRTATRLVPNKNPTGHGNTRHAYQVKPSGVPKAAGQATSTAAKATAGTAGRMAGKAGVGVAARVVAGRAAAGVGGALGGPAGTVVTTCAFEGGYQLGSELGRRNNPITPPHPGGKNKILRKQPNGRFEWVEGPKTVPKANIHRKSGGQGNGLHISQAAKQALADDRAKNGQIDHTREGEIARQKLQMERLKNQEELKRLEKLREAQKQADLQAAAKTTAQNKKNGQDALNLSSTHKSYRDFDSDWRAHLREVKQWEAGKKVGPRPVAPKASDYI